MKKIYLFYGRLHKIDQKPNKTTVDYGKIC